MKGNKIRVVKKYIREEYTYEIGFLHGLCTKYSSPQWYEKYLMKKLNVKKKFEIRRECVY